MDTLDFSIYIQSPLHSAAVLSTIVVYNHYKVFGNGDVQ